MSRTTDFADLQPTQVVETDASGRTLNPNQPIISGRIGNAMDQPIAPFNTLFNDIWTQNGITHNNTNGRFTVPVAGRYRIVFNAFTNTGYGSYRIVVGVNNDDPTHITCYGQMYSNSNQHQPLPLYAVLDLQANDYIVLRLREGRLYNNPTTDWFNDFSIELIG